jgi:hypothetical protein
MKENKLLIGVRSGFGYVCLFSGGCAISPIWRLARGRFAALGNSILLGNHGISALGCGSIIDKTSAPRCGGGDGNFRSVLREFPYPGCG